MMEFLDNVVYSNILRSSEAAFLEVEKAMVTVATLVPMFTIIIRSKKSKTFLAKCTLTLVKKHDLDM